MLSLALSQNQVRYNFCSFIFYLDLCTPHLSYITLHYITLFITLPHFVFGLWQFKASWLARNSRTTWQVATPCGANNSRGSSVKSLSGLINQSECGIGLCSVWGEREENPKLCWGSQIVKLYAALHAHVYVSQRVYVCMLCCCCCRTLQQHFRRKAVNLSNVCTLSPYRQTRQLPLSAPSPHCAARQGRHTPRWPTHWTGVFWKTHYALRHFRGSLHTVRGARELSLFLCEIFEAMRNQSSDAIPTGTRERQTSLICIFCSFLREEKNKREREWMKETQRESCGRQAARKTDWQSNLKLHP